MKKLPFVLITVLLICCTISGIIFGLFISTRSGQFIVGGDDPVDTTRSLKLYVSDGNFVARTNECKATGFVERRVALAEYTIENAVNMLLQNKLTAAEQMSGLVNVLVADKSPGITSRNVNVESVSINFGVATIAFSDPELFTTGGACRVSIMREQIEKTVLEFPDIDEVVIEPSTVFLP